MTNPTDTPDNPESLRQLLVRLVGGQRVPAKEFPVPFLTFLEDYGAAADVGGVVRRAAAPADIDVSTLVRLFLTKDRSLSHEQQEQAWARILPIGVSRELLPIREIPETPSIPEEIRRPGLYVARLAVHRTTQMALVGKDVDIFTVRQEGDTSVFVLASPNQFIVELRGAGLDRAHVFCVVYGTKNAEEELR